MRATGRFFEGSKRQINVWETSYDFGTKACRESDWAHAVRRSGLTFFEQYFLV